MVEATHDELNRIINRVLVNYSENKDVSLTDEINLYCEKYRYRVQTNPQLSIFEEAVPNVQAVKSAVLFCEDLDYIKQKTDIDEEETTLSATICRRMLKQLAKYEPYITTQNKGISQRLAKTLKRYLPEYKKAIMFEDYNADIDLMLRVKNGKNRDDFFLERSSMLFFKTINQDEYLQNMEACPEKINLYEKSVQIVNFLPGEKYSRTKKYKLKQSIYEKIKEMAIELGSDYEKTLQNATKEAARFKKAAEGIEDYWDGKKSRKPPKSFEEITEERNRRAYEEWLYK